MALWDQVKQPPAEMLKPIKSGRLKGMTDIKPHWRYREATRRLGPCGDGWAYTIDKQWTEPGADGEIVANTNVTLRVKIDGKWGLGIPGTGAAKFAMWEHKGQPDERLYTNDEAFKMSLTDALSVAFGKLGFGADVYLGHWDGNQFAEEIDEDILRDWETACRDAASGSLVEIFAEWWPKNKPEIIEGLGEGGAAKVYQVFRALLDRKRADENAAD
jgi:hypothetical protein